MVLELHHLRSRRRCHTYLCAGPDSISQQHERAEYMPCEVVESVDDGDHAFCRCGGCELQVRKATVALGSLSLVTLLRAAHVGQLRASEHHLSTDIVIFVINFIAVPLDSVSPQQYTPEPLYSTCLSAIGTILDVKTDFVHCYPTTPTSSRSCALRKEKRHLDVSSKPARRRRRTKGRELS